MLGFVEVGVTGGGKALVAQNSLLLGVEESLFFNSLFKADERAELCSNRTGHPLDVNLHLAGRALHEGEAYAKARPLVLEKIDNAVRVEDVATAQSRASLHAKLSGVANAAKFICVDASFVMGTGAGWAQAWQTVSLVGHSLTRVAAFELFAAGLEGRLALVGDLSCVDHKRLDFFWLRKFKNRDLNHHSGVRVASDQGRSVNVRRKQPFVRAEGERRISCKV